MQFRGLAIAVATICSASGVFAEDVPPKLPKSIASRLYLSDTSSYDLIGTALGKLGEVDRANNLVTSWIDKAHLLCTPDQMRKKTTLQSFPNARAFYSVMDSKSTGSLTLFTGSADLGTEQRMQVYVDDIGAADMPPECQLNAESIADIVKRIPSAVGKRIFYVTGGTISHLSKETFSKDSGGGGLSVGSFLKIGVDYYKGSQQADSVPLISLRGFYIDVPKKSLADAVSDIQSGAAKLVTFSTLGDLGLNPDGLALAKRSTPETPARP